MGFEGAYFMMRMGTVKFLRKVVTYLSNYKRQQYVENCKYPVIYLNLRERSVNTLEYYMTRKFLIY
jgi:hypothetical protein